MRATTAAASSLAKVIGTAGEGGGETISLPPCSVVSTEEKPCQSNQAACGIA